MKTVKVRLKEHSYDVVIGRGALCLLGRRAACLLGTKKVLLVTTPKIHKLFGRKAVRALERSGIRAFVHLAPEGEGAKTERELFRIYRSALRAGLDRASGIIALGGGAVGDVAGFAASTYLRGIAFINLPTTLLAQVDSSIGGKTAINLEEGKNLVGTFYQPSLVIADTAFLKTLPEREYRSSLAEVVKYGIIRSGEFFRFLEKRRARLLRREEKTLDRVIAVSSRIKARIVERGERGETGLRASRLLGHPFAHAYEKAARFRKLLHGEAVAMGIGEAARMAERLGRLAPSKRSRIEALFSELGLPTDASRFGFSPSLIRRVIARDKKRRGENVHFILPTDIGRVSSVPVRIGSRMPLPPAGQAGF